MVERQRFFVSIGASALLHFLILAALLAQMVAGPRPLTPPTIDVDLSALPLPAAARPAPAAKAPAVNQPAPPAPAVPRRQIVEPSDAGEEKEPENAQLLSDRNNAVPEEMVRQGDQGKDPEAVDPRLSRQPPVAPPAAPVPPAPAAKPAAPAPPAAKVERPAAAKPRSAEKAAPASQSRPRAAERGDDIASLPSLDRLLPRASDLAQADAAAGVTPRTQGGRDLLNSGGEDVFTGRPGTRDFLPRIRAGNITMLNTKADLYAPFVRRVAGRVFENLDLALSNLRGRRDVASGRAQATVEAMMERNGRFAGARLVERSGVNAVGVDRLLLDAAQPDIFFDANPPAGAEAPDGKIHFILLVDLNVDTVPDPRTGRQTVTYFGIAGVGLK